VEKIEKMISEKTRKEEEEYMRNKRKVLEKEEAYMRSQTPTMKHLDDRGRCCGRKPLVYKRPKHQFFCARCDAHFDPSTGIQIEGWAYPKVDGGFVRRFPPDGDRIVDLTPQEAHDIISGAKPSSKED
jgi:hypothetical protein